MRPARAFVARAEINGPPCVQDIFVFVVGGATYEEARAVALLNAANKQQRIILGSTCMLNSATFLKEFEKAAAA